jgi:hypothetical protein
MVQGLFFIKDSKGKYKIIFEYKEEGRNIYEESAEESSDFASIIIEMSRLYKFEIPKQFWQKEQVYFTPGFSEAQMESVNSIRNLFLEKIGIESKVTELEEIIRKMRRGELLKDDDISF